jgi:hypothetical protein
MMVVRIALRYAAIVLIFVLYVQDCVQGVLSIQMNYVLYVQKFVKPVLKNVLNTLNIMKAAKHVQKLVKNVQKPAHKNN